MDSSSLAHSKWECQYHIVFVPKYRKKKLYGIVRDDMREIIRTLCKYKKVEIIAGAVCADHVHLCVSIPPKLSVSDFVGYLKGKSALMIYDKHPEMESKWDRSFWARGYYVTTREHLSRGISPNDEIPLQLEVISSLFCFATVNYQHEREGNKLRCHNSDDLQFVRTC